MQLLALVWGVLAIIGFGVAFIPCLGALNWLNIPFAIAGVIVSLIALYAFAPRKPRNGYRRSDPQPDRSRYRFHAARRRALHSVIKSKSHADTQKLRGRHGGRAARCPDRTQAQLRFHPRR